MGQIHLSSRLLCGLRIYYKFNLFCFFVWWKFNHMILLLRDFHFMITFEPNENSKAGATISDIISYKWDNDLSIYMVLKFLSDILLCWGTPWKCVWLFYKRSRVVQMTSAATTVGSSVYLKFKSDIIAGALTPGKSWN